MDVARAVGLVAALVLALAACGGNESSEQVIQPDTGVDTVSVSDSLAQLPDLARALVPPEALDDSVDADEFVIEECGIQPVFPCVSVYFMLEDLDLDERVALVRAHAVSAGWKIVSERREGGFILDIERGDYGGEYMFESDDPLLCETAPRCLTGTTLTVYAPPAPLPAPSAAERAQWTEEKKAFVASANAVCAETEARIQEPDDVAPALAYGLEELAALEPPDGDEEHFARVLRPLRIVVEAARALNDDQGEEALPAAVALAESIKRFNETASRYGLGDCATLG